MAIPIECSIEFDYITWTARKECCKYNGVHVEGKNKNIYDT